MNSQSLNKKFSQRRIKSTILSVRREATHITLMFSSLGRGAQNRTLDLIKQRGMGRLASCLWGLVWFQYVLRGGCVGGGIWKPMTFPFQRSFHPCLREFMGTFLSFPIQKSTVGWFGFLEHWAPDPKHCTLNLNPSMYLGLLEIVSLPDTNVCCQCC